MKRLARHSRVLICVLWAGSISTSLFAQEADRQAARGEFLRGKTIPGELGAVKAERTIHFSEIAEGERMSPPPSPKQQKPLKESPLQARAVQKEPTPSETIGSELSAAKAAKMTLGPSPVPSASFPALLSDGTDLNPDTHGAVGPNHLVVTLNTSVVVQDRSGNVLSSVSLDGFWSSTGASNVYDPRVIYDPYGQRWVVTAECDPGGRNPGLLVGASATSNPMGNWYLKFIDLNASRPEYGDSPNVGFNKNWIVVSLNVFSSTTHNFLGTDVYVFNKATLYSGAATTPTRFPMNADSVAPAMVYDPDLAEVYLANVYAGSVPEFDPETGGTVNYGELDVWKVSGSASAPVLSFVDTVYSCPECTWADGTPSANFAPQLGSTNRIYAGDTRLQNLVYRGGSYFTVHTVFTPTGKPTNAAVQWWEFLPEDEFGYIHMLIQERITDSTGGFFAFPSIAINQNYEGLIGYTRFSTNTHPSAHYTYVGADGFNREDRILKAGESSYKRLDAGGINLWGDWSATAVDPVNDTDFWTIQQYSARNGNVTNLWGTWWGQVSPPHDLRLGMTRTPNPATAGFNLTYTLRVTNHVGTANGVQLTNTLPPLVTFSSVTTTRGSCVYSNGVVVCNLGTMEEDGTASISIIVKPTASGLVTNQAIVMAKGSDANSTNNTASVVTTVNQLLTNITLTRSPANNPLLRFNSSTGRTYFVEARSSLSAGAWTVLGTMSGTGAMMSFEDTTAPQGSRFYRIRVN